MYLFTDLPNNETNYTEELCQAITDLLTGHSQSTIWIGGDANLPDIDWSNSSITCNNYSLHINTAFVNVVNDICAEQVVTFSTCLENTLDIFCTNRPTLVSKCTSITGMSDHDIVLTDTIAFHSDRNQQKDLYTCGKKQVFLVWKMTLISFQKPSPQSFLLILPLTRYRPPSRQRASHLSKTCNLQTDLLQV